MINKGFSTLAIKSAERNKSIIRAAAHRLGTAENATRLYAWQDVDGDIYTRISNPTVRDFETTIAALEGGTAAVATASGQAAVYLALEALLQPGYNFISSPKIYGGTTALFNASFPKFGFETRWGDPANPQSFADQIDDRTCALFIETISNPDGVIPDFEGLAALAKTKNIPLIVDNTLASPYLFQPLKHGAHIVIHSTTKYINGLGNAIGGVIIDGGNYPWKNCTRFPSLSEPLPWGDKSLAELFPETAYAALLRLSLALFGACQAPDNAVLTLEGLKTLALRMDRHVSNAQAVAEYLVQHPLVASVYYPGLKDDPNHTNAKKYLPRGQGAIVLFTLKGGQNTAVEVLHNLNIFVHKPNIGEPNSLVLHPATTTHSKCSPEQLKAAKIFPGTLRLAIGLEDPDDLIADLDQALSAAEGKTRMYAA